MTQQKDLKLRPWRDWATWGIHWAVILSVAAASAMIRVQADPPPDDLLGPLLIPVGIAVALNLLLLPFIVVKGLRDISDWIGLVFSVLIAGVLSILADGEPLVLLGLTATLSISGLLRLGAGAGFLQLITVTMIPLGVQLVTVEGYTDNLTPLLPVGLLWLGLTVSVGLWVYLRDHNIGQEQRALSKLRQQAQSEMDAMRDAVQAVAQLSGTLNANLDYNSVLDAALDVGRLSLRDKDRFRVLSVVMLYRAGADVLKIVNARGLSHLDQEKEIRGKAGIVAQALEDAQPVFSGEVKNDSELGHFVSMTGIKSTLCVPLRAGFVNYGVLLFASEAPDAFDENQIEVLQAIGTQATLALQNAVLYSNLLEEKERILEIEENSRKALVRDLHDIPTQTISAVTMRIRIIQKLMEKDRSAEVPEELDNVEEMAQRATEEIRHVLFKLRPLALESQGLLPALEQLVEKTRKTYKQNITLQATPGCTSDLNEAAQGALFYLIEEAVSNARKYAEATAIQIKLGRKNGYLIARVKDNGVGFDMSLVTDNYEARGSFGMVNMHERAEMVGGTLDLQSAPGKGTAVTVMIPITDEAETDSRRRASGLPQTKLAMSAKARVNRDLGR